MTKTKRNYSLDFLKVVAASGIVFHHFQAITGVKYKNFINFSGDWFNWGYLVELFFILSGYFVYRYIPLIQKGGITLLDWWKKRAVRLLPVSAITVLVYELIVFLNNTIVGGYVWGTDVAIWNSIVTALGLQEGWVFINPYINSSLWYISVLMVCSVFFYILTALAARIKCNPIYFYVAMILFGFAIGVYGFNKPFMNWQVARGYYSFFFGILLAMYVNKYGINRREIVISTVSLTFFTLLFIFYQKYSVAYTNYMVTFFVFPAIVILLETRISERIFRHKVWETLSAISFEVYLWHMPILISAYFFMNLFKVSTDFASQPDYVNLILMFVFLLAVWVFATFTYFFIERPITRRLTHKKEEKAEEK